MFEPQFYRVFGKIIYALILPGGKMTEEEKELILEVMDSHLIPRLGKRAVQVNRPWEQMFNYPEGSEMFEDVSGAFFNWQQKFNLDHLEPEQELLTKLMNVLSEIAEIYGLVDLEHRDLLAGFRKKILRPKR
ncbi:MAG TPA: hypothetical protein ENJ82_08055 [Bacteroidetes bacterium]|nr:hypothetical protein [Bacteroidota bacterium]